MYILELTRALNAREVSWIRAKGFCAYRQLENNSFWKLLDFLFFFEFLEFLEF